MSNSYYHIIHFTLPNHLVDSSQGILYDHDCLGLEEVKLSDQLTRLKVYFEAREEVTLFIQKLKELLPKAENFDGTTIDLSTINFKAQTFEPLELCHREAGFRLRNKNYWIVPPPDMSCENSPPPNSSHLIIRPGAAFGTGRHETTQLAAEMMCKLFSPSPWPSPVKGEGKTGLGSPLPWWERVRERGISLLDVGCGSGVLAILAKLLGIKNVTAVEIDTLARDNALENFQLNHFSEIKLYSRLQEVKETFDIIVANIITPTLIYLKDDLIKRLKPQGILILSGIMESEVPKIKKAYENLQIIHQTQKNEWVCFGLVL